MNKIVCLNGTFVDEKNAMVSVLDNGFLYADGFYDTMRVYDAVIFELPLHLKRIERSATVMDIAVPKTKKLTGWLQAIVRINKLQEARVRITMTRGVGSPTVLITCERLGKTSVRGATACTMHLTRTWPSLKTLGGLAILGPAALEKKKRGVEQILMIDAKGFVREAATSNVFIVRSGRLWTPKNAILRGLTRKRVLTLARRSGIRVIVRDFKMGMLHNADEIFLTNRIREIIPILELNGKKVGSGKTGPVTKKLMKAYGEYVSRLIS